MESKMEIGKAIKEKLEGLNQNPDSQVWEKIEKNLDAKTERRPIFWIFPLIVFIGFTSFLAYNLFAEQTNNKSNGFHEKDTVHGNINKNTQNKSNQNKVISIQKVANKESLTNNKTDIIIKNSATESTIIQKDSALRRNNKSDVRLKNKFIRTTRLVRSNSKYDEYEVTLKRRYFYKKYKSKIKYSSASMSKIKPKKKLVLKNHKKSGIVNGAKDLKTSAIENAFVENNSANKTDTVNNLNYNLDVTPPISATSTAIINKEIRRKVKKNVLADTTKIKKPQDKKFKIILSPYFGPTYYDSFGNENLITNQELSSEKKGLLTYNFGIYFRSMASEKFGIRLGFGKTDYNYSVSTLNDNNFIDINTVNLVNYTENQIYSLFSNDSKVKFVQKTSYFEVPIEAYFVIKDFKKFEIAATGGLSLLFLRDNSLTLQSDAIPEIIIGTNKKTLEFGYTVNAGFCFGYKLTKKLNFDVSPSFKYQFIEVIRDADFQPFSLNLQAGFSFKL